jgi:hypothetical protein
MPFTMLNPFGISKDSDNKTKQTPEAKGCAHASMHHGCSFTVSISCTSLGKGIRAACFSVEASSSGNSHPLQLGTSVRGRGQLGTSSRPAFQNVREKETNRPTHPFRLASNSIDKARSLFEGRRIPTQMVMYHIPAIDMEVDGTLDAT